jgi:hypothetical protein
MEDSMKRLLAVAVPLLALLGCSSPLEPQSQASTRAAKAKATLEAATKQDRDDRIAAN